MAPCCTLRCWRTNARRRRGPRGRLPCTACRSDLRRRRPARDRRWAPIWPARSMAAELADGDVVVVTSKIVSKAEGRTIDSTPSTPSPFAVEWAALGTRTRGHRARAARGQACRASGRAGADHRDPPRLRVRELGSRPVDERCVGSRRAAAARPRRVGAPDPDRSSPSTASTWQSSSATPSGERGARARPTSPSASPACADSQLHRPGRPARPRVQGAGAVCRRRAGRCR